MEEIKVYNTLTKEKEVFHPIKEGEAKIYVCGVTPYNHPHIGNARPAVTWDIIRRYLEFIGYKVTFVQNFTDVDDKIINKANAEGSDWKTISDRYIDAYFEVMDKLHVRRADIYPRVSDHMKDIIDMVKTLIEKGHAYVLGGDVYYDISTFKDYGKLSGRKIEDMLAGARIEVNDEKEIRETLHFGKRQSPANHSGKARGARDARAGTSNARPCLPTIWAIHSTSMAAAAI